MIKKLILSIFLYFALAGNAGAFSTGTLIQSNFGNTTVVTTCNAVKNKCYFLKSGLFYKMDGTLISGQSTQTYIHIFTYGDFIYGFTSTGFIFKIDTNTDIYSQVGRAHPGTTNTSLTLSTMINDILCMEWLWSGTRYYFTFDFSNNTILYKGEGTTGKNALLSSVGITTNDFIYDLGLYNYKIDSKRYSIYSNNLYSKIGTTKTNVFTGIPFAIKNYNVFKFGSDIIISYSTTSLQGGAYLFSYKNGLSYNVPTNRYIQTFRNTDLLYISDSDYQNQMYNLSTSPVNIPVYNIGTSQYDIYYIGKDSGLYYSGNFTGGTEAIGGGGTGGSTTTTGTGGSTTTREKDSQTCTLKSFSGVLSGTGTNEIIYNSLSTGSLYGTLYNGGIPIIQSQLQDYDLLNMFNDTQLSFTGYFDGPTQILETTFLYRANTVNGYPKTIDIYIGEQLNSLHGNSIFSDAYMRGDDGILYQIPNWIGTFGNKYTLKINDNTKITSLIFKIKGTDGKKPSLQKFKFYGENTSQTKTRYECTYNDKFCGWDTYYTSQKKSYCIENGDFNQIKDEYIGDTEKTESFFDFSPIIDGFNSIKDSLTGTGTGTGGTIASGSGSFGTGSITFSSGAGNFTSLVGVGTGVDCSNMFINGVFQYSYGNKTNFMTFVGWDLFSKLGFQRWEVKILGVNLVGWVYDLLNVTCSSISNLLLYAFNLLFNNFDFIYYLFNEPVRGQDYCYFGIKLKVYAVWETNHFGTTNKRQFDYFVTVFIMLSLLYLIIRK